MNRDNVKIFSCTFQGNKSIFEKFYFSFSPKIQSTLTNVVKFFVSVEITGVFCRAQVLDPLVLGGKNGKWAGTVNFWLPFGKNKTVLDLVFRQTMYTCVQILE